MLINKLLDLLEDLYYERKEEIADALTKLLKE